VVFGGDFCQTLLIVPGGICQQVVAASLCRGNLWKNIKFFHFRHNMCLGYSEADDYHHIQWLLEISAGTTIDDSNMIQVPQPMLCTDLNTLINRVYSRISHQGVKDDQYFLDRIILCSRNDEVHNINEAILQQFNPEPNTEVYMLRSVDSVSEEDEMHHAYSAEFL